MRVSQGVNLIWTGTNATVPGGYSRNTNLDSKFIKGAANATNPNDTGGATTHTHSAAANHSHTESAHTHTWTVGIHPFAGSSASETNGDIARADHVHSVTGQSMSGGGMNSVSATYAAVSNDPPYINVIFIQSDGTKSVPSNVVSFSQIAAPTNFSEDSSLNGKFIRGAATGADAEGTGGSSTNVHVLTHTHTVSTHTHSVTTGAGSQRCGNRTDAGNGVNRLHTHTFTSSAVSSTYSGTITLTTAETVEPAYTQLIAVKNTSGTELQPYIGMVGLWLGTLANIPAGWVLCDGTNDTTDMRGRYLKATSVVGSLAATGGSNTHTHAAQSHSHTAGTHTHTVASGLNHTSKTFDSDSGISTQETNVTIDNTHASTVTTNSSSFASGSTSASSSSNEPAYRTVAFIKLNSVVTPAANLIHLL